MKPNTDETAYFEAWLDVPFGTPGPGRTKSQAFQTPGCHVMTTARDASGRWPMYFGRLASYDAAADVVVVVSKGRAHGVDGKSTVWTGTVSEYARMWRID